MKRGTFTLIAAFGAILAFAPNAGAVDFSGPTDYPVGSNELSLVKGDFNADGDPDLASTEAGSGGVNVLLGGAGGSFTGPTNFPIGGSFHSGMALGQFDAGTDPDLVVAESSGVQVLLGGSGGTFGASTAYTAGNFPSDVAVDSFDGDSDPDLAVANYNSGDVSILHGGAGGSFGAPTSYSLGGPAPVAIATGNFNGDAYRDVVTANNVNTTNRLSVLLGGPSGLGAPTHYNAGDAFWYYQADSLAIGDFNGDADPDIAVANRDSDNVSILLGSTGGTFTGPTNFRSPPATIPPGWRWASSTPTRTRTWSWQMRRTQPETSRCCSEEPGGTFGAPSYFPASNPTSVVVGDFDADTDDDVATAAYGNGYVSVLLQIETVGYARPKGASPVTIRFVPAFNQCGGSSPAGMTHGPPLAQPSCSPPVQSSNYLTLNAPDRAAPFNTAASGSGYLNLRTYCTNGQTPPCPLAGDQEDVELLSPLPMFAALRLGPTASRREASTSASSYTTSRCASPTSTMVPA